MVTKSPTKPTKTTKKRKSNGTGFSLDTLKFLRGDARLRGLGVDLMQYSSLLHRTEYKPIETQTNREIHWPIIKSFAAQVRRKVPDPILLTHIVTTRCNYSCHFCSFADSLNQKTNELKLAEIEKAYATIGGSLNSIIYSGGETTINKELPEIIEAAYRLTSVKSVYIISNAWKPNLLFEITHRIMQTCPELHLTWSLSIEGPKAHNNQTRHTQSDNWDAWQNTVDTAEGFKKMREVFGYKQLDIQMCTVCTPDNVEVMDDWYDMVKYVLKPDKWNLNLMRRSVQMDDTQLATFDERRQAKTLEPFEEKYLEITQRIYQDVLAGELSFLYHTKTPMDGALKSAVDLISQAENQRTLREEPQTFCCKAGTTGAFIGSEGEVAGCEEFAMNPTASKVFGNLREVDGDFQKIWHSEAAEKYRAEVGNAQECNGCTLESQRNYPAILVSVNSLVRAKTLAGKLIK